MNLRNVRTSNDLQQYLSEHVAIEGVDRVESMEWFVAMTEAANISDSFGRTDLASILLDGYAPIKNNPQAVSDFVATFFEDYDYYRTNVNENTPEDVLNDMLTEAVNGLQAVIQNHFGSTYTP